MLFGKSNQSKNRTFNYQPRFSKENKEEVATEKDFISKWNENRKQNRKVKGMLSLPVALFLLVVLLIGMYLLNTYLE